MDEKRGYLEQLPLIKGVDPEPERPQFGLHGERYSASPIKNEYSELTEPEPRDDQLTLFERSLFD